MHNDVYFTELTVTATTRPVAHMHQSNNHHTQSNQCKYVYNSQCNTIKIATMGMLQQMTVNATTRPIAHMHQSNNHHNRSNQCKYLYNSQCHTINNPQRCVSYKIDSRCDHTTRHTDTIHRIIITFGQTIANNGTMPNAAQSTNRNDVYFTKLTANATTRPIAQMHYIE